MKKIVCLCLLVIILTFDYLVILSEVEESHFCFAQNPEWLTFTANNQVNSVITVGDSLWIATEGCFVKMHKITKEKTYYQNYFYYIPATGIHSMIKDYNEIIWMGTNIGLVKYDGFNWLVYDTNNSGMPDNNIYKLDNDKNGNLWFNTKKGLVKFDGNNWILYDEYKNVLTDTYLNAFTIDSNSNIWIGNRYGLAKFDQKNWNYFKKENSGLPDTVIKILATDKDGNLWIVTSKGITMYNGTNWTVYDTNNSKITDNDIDAMTIDVNNSIWIATYKGVSYFDENEWKLFDLGEYGRYSKSIIKLQTEKNGKLWMGCYDGRLILYEKNEIIDFNYPFSALTSEDIKALFTDKNNNIWIQSAGWITSSVKNFNGQEWKDYTKLDSATYVGGNIFAQDSSGNIWTDVSIGIGKFDGKNWTIYSIPDTIDIGGLGKVFVIDKNDNKWFGSYWNGLVKFDGTNWTKFDTANSDLQDNWIRSLALDKEQNLWIGTTKGLVKFDGTNWTLYNKQNSGLPYNRINVVAIDKNDNIWVGGNSMLSKFDGTNWTIYDTSNIDLQEGFSVNCIEVDNYNNVWVGPKTGLYKFDGNKWININLEYSTSIGKVNALAIDKRGNKWIGQEEGFLDRYNGILHVFREEGVILDILSEPEDNDYTKSNSKNYPNPFQYATNIEYELEKGGNVTIEVYNMQGQLVRELFSGVVDGGKHTAVWDGRTETEIEVPNGIYIYKVQFEGNVITGKMVLIK